MKIIDFGLGNWWKKGLLKTSCGSPNYAAPELFLSKPYLGPPVDVWALGVMLFGMLTGEFPFDEIQATLDVDYEWPEEPNPLIKDLVAKTFTFNPEHRITATDLRNTPLVVAAAADRGHASFVENEAVRSDLISKMEQDFGMPLELVVKSLRDEEVNQMTATYWMLRRSNSKQQNADDSKSKQDIEASIKKAQMQAELSLSSIVQRGKEAPPVQVSSPQTQQRIIKSKK